eukprot:m.11143 g.11143  ORF g.11143 m.11143 type:complete len:73 (-) comp6822_c0_seq1:395-613(-)
MVHNTEALCHSSISRKKEMVESLVKGDKGEGCDGRGRGDVVSSSMGRGNTQLMVAFVCWLRISFLFFICNVT